jgi:hypothetical protein
MFFSVSEFSSDWLTMDEMSQIFIIPPGLLLSHASDVFFTDFLKVPYTDMSKG